MPLPTLRTLLSVGLLLLAAPRAHAVLDRCSFNFGMSWDKGPSFPAEVGYVTIWTNWGFDGSYHGAMLNALRSTDKTPVFYGYLIAKGSRLGDCDVTGGSNLCTEGANYIRGNLDKIADAYKSFAQSAAAIWGTEKQIVFLIEPDFYQYFQAGSQNDNPIPFDSARLVMGRIHDAVRSALPQAEFSFDISPWAPSSSWYRSFDTASFSWANTSGGRTQGGTTKIRSENPLTWATAAKTFNRGIIADIGYGVGGGPDANGIAAWNELSNLNARIADGVVGLTNVLADYSWGATLAALRPKLTGTLKSCVQAGPRVSRFALGTTVTGAGSVARDLPGPSYDSGKVVRLAALPAIGHRFVSWSGAATGTSPFATVTMDKVQSVTATFAPTEAGPPVGTGTELVRGGDFASGASEWSLAVNCGAATGGVVGGAYAVNVTEAGSAGYCLQFRQTGLNLEAGKTYQFSFEAKASAPRSLIGYVGQDGAPYTNYLLGSTGDWTVEATTQSQVFSKTFTMASTDASGRIDLNLGGAGTGTVTIDNVSLRSGRALPRYALATTVVGPATNRIVRVPDQPAYDSGTAVALFAVPDSVTRFQSWSGDASGALASTIVVLDQDRRVSAVFGNVGVGARQGRSAGLRREGDRLVVEAVSADATLSLLDMEGRTVRTLHRGPLAGSLALAMPTDLPRGLYVARLRTEGGLSSLPLPLAR